MGLNHPQTMPAFQFVEHLPGPWGQKVGAHWKDGYAQFNCLVPGRRLSEPSLPMQFFSFLQTQKGATRTMSNKMLRILHC